MKWVRSTRCETSACVEVAFVDSGIAVRDSKDPDGPILKFALYQWEAFMSGLVAGEFGDSG